ncbi:LysR family transcriptional regulator [Dongshaea marina]|uniref:LysR family transcriptional regulator n=1 Tax=Dongshaea marina TaxID=2047966 RepID=UPI00131F0E69|nr:LysR family transcriptional regulator [Dongshaea marina]
MKEINRMKVFVVAARAGSFSQAGRQLNLSPSSVSRQVSAIEEELEVRLLHRTTHHLSLTEAGTLYYQRVTRLLDELDEIHHSLMQHKNQPKGQLKLNVSGEFASLYISPHIGEFLMLYPDIRVDLNINNDRVNLVEQDVDLAIRYDSMEDSSLIARKLPVDHGILVGASPAYLARNGQPRTPEELLEYHCILAKSVNTDLWLFRKGQEVREVRVSGRLASNSGIAIVNAVKDGAGIAMMPRWIAQPELSSGEIMPVLGDYTCFNGSLRERFLYALYPDRHYLPLKVKLFLEFIVQKISES